MHRQQSAHSLLVPHTRLLQFLRSHYNASRSSSPHTERAYLRLLKSTLEALRRATGHPLAREIRFQIVSFGLRVLRYTTALDFDARCRLKDQILSAALSWFSFPPRWTFGGNRLQLKAEVRLLVDISASFKYVAIEGPRTTFALRSLQAKEDLLDILIKNEYARLSVWLFPLHEAQREPPNAAFNVKTPSEVRMRDMLFSNVLSTLC